MIFMTETINQESHNNYLTVVYMFIGVMIMCVLCVSSALGGRGGVCVCLVPEGVGVVCVSSA